MLAKYLALFALVAGVTAAPTPDRGDNDSADTGSDAPANVTSGTYSGGRATYYNVEENTGACGYRNTNDELVVAVNKDDYTTEWCGSFVNITAPKTGNTAVARVVDLCPTCSHGSLDMSTTLFDKLNNGNRDDGVFPITFERIATPAGEEEMSYAY